jgi:hypothetical protein
MNLLFKKAVFHKGVNVTVRRGVKWDVGDKENVCIIDMLDPTCLDKEMFNYGQDKVIAVVDIKTKVKPFVALLGSRDLLLEHDPDCRTYSGLFNVMQEIYPDFEESEIVTIVYFNISDLEI